MTDIDALKASISLSSVVGGACDLKRAGGGELVTCCPFHNDTRPSFYVNDEKGFYLCRSCGAAGNVIGFVMAYNKMSFKEAIAALQAGVELSLYSPPALPKVTQSRSGEWARKIWRSAVPLAETPGEQYLRNRGLSGPWLTALPALRFVRLSYPGRAGEYPALIAGISAPTGDIVAIQRIYLTEDGRKLDVAAPKLSLGPRPGGAIRLGDGESDIIICEGLEDGLSILSDVPDATVWVAAGANMMKSVVLPDACKTVVIARDNDVAGERAASEAAEKFRDSGRHVHSMAPSPGCKDFNEMILKRGVS